jgi:hypothetical protein
MTYLDEPRVTNETRTVLELRALKTLLDDAKAYLAIPHGMTPDWFIKKEHRSLFNALMAQVYDREMPPNEVRLFESHPEFIPLFLSMKEYEDLPLEEFTKTILSLNPMASLAESRPLDAQDRIFHFKMLNGSEIETMEIPEQSFIVKNLISETSLNFLTGEEGCGKSMLAMNLALSVAIGATQWLGYEIVKHGKVIYLNNELSLNDHLNRIKIMQNHLPCPGDVSNLLTPQEFPDLETCWETLNDFCNTLRPILIIVDCFYFTHNKDENDSSSMKDLMRKFQTLRDRYQLSILVLHHTKKGGRDKKMGNDLIRGSNVFSAAADTVLQMKRSADDERQRIIKPTKLRHVSDEMRTCRLLSLNPESLWFKDEGETDEADHLETVIPTAEEEISFQEILKAGEIVPRKEIIERCEPYGYNRRTIDRQLKRAKESGKLKTPKPGCYSL